LTAFGRFFFTCRSQKDNIDRVSNNLGAMMDTSPIVECDVTLELSITQRIKINRLLQGLEDLLNFAHQAGMIITVDVQSLDPLAMRNVRMVGNVRSAR
jgi:hypothetical protein